MGGGCLGAWERAREGLASQEGDPGGPPRGLCAPERTRGAGGDAELPAEEGEPKPSETRGVRDTRGLRGGGGGGVPEGQSRGNTGNRTERVKEGRVVPNMD